MKKIFLSFFCLIYPSFFLFSVEPYEGKLISQIRICVESHAKEISFDTKAILASLKTKKNHPFFQLIFDEDLKKLSQDYERIEPNIILQNEQLYISIKLWPKPIIRSIHWHGNRRFSTSSLQKELKIKPNEVFHRDAFLQNLNKVKEFYLKKGYFESQITYKIHRLVEKNEIDLNIYVVEGRSGKIKKIQFKGLSKSEADTVKQEIVLRPYNKFSCWLTGKGLYREEIIEQDEMTILNFLQNKGYADAKIETKILDDPTSNQIIIQWTIHRGPLYHFGTITYEGNTILSDQEITKRFLIHSGDIYSPEKIRDTEQAIKDAYGSKGYIETDVTYETHLLEKEPIYNVRFTISEGESFKIGMIRIFGNVNTESNVILRESLLVPGEVFNSKKLQATQQRLQNIGYFKNVNVYAVKSTEDIGLGSNYRDVHIEVEEMMTGSASLFVGFSSQDNVVGGLDITERNFNYRGLLSPFKKQKTSLRGGGEFAHAKITVGKKQYNGLISWLTPYFRDSLWRVGFEGSYTYSSLQSKDYRIITYGGSIFASYPLTNFWTFGMKYRLRNADIDVKKNAGEEAKEQERNSGLISAFGISFSYDSTDNPYKAHNGLRSAYEAEVTGVGGDFTFLKFGWLNSLYQPLWSKGTMRYRAEFRFIEPFGSTTKDKIPLSERFFLGGEGSVRGYRPYILGPHYKKDDPTGGISCTLLSVEYSQEILKFLDVMAFADAGNVTLRHFKITKLNASVGCGIRLEVMNHMPFIFGYAYPINSSRKSDEERFFFSMGGQF